MCQEGSLIKNRSSEGGFVSGTERSRVGISNPSIANAKSLPPHNYGGFAHTIRPFYEMAMQ